MNRLAAMQPAVLGSRAAFHMKLRSHSLLQFLLLGSTRHDLSMYSSRVLGVSAALVRKESEGAVKGCPGLSYL